MCKCNKCNLSVHLLRHEGVKPYVCSECSMTFFTAGDMRRHQLKHSEFKQFCCGLCGKYFKYKEKVVSQFKKRSVKSTQFGGGILGGIFENLEKTLMLDVFFDVTFLDACGLCGKYFRYKENVASQFKKRSVKSTEFG